MLKQKHKETTKDWMQFVLENFLEVEVERI